MWRHMLAMYDGIAFTLLILVGAQACWGAPPELSATNLEEQLVESRHALKSGHVLLRISNPSNNEKTEHRYEFIFDGPRRRLEITDPPGSFRRPHSARPSEYGRTRIYTVTSEQFITHVTEDGPNPGAYVATVKGLRQILDFEENDPASAAAQVSYQLVFDPRVIGMVPYQFGHWWLADLEGLYRSSDRSDISVQATQAGSTELLRESFRTPNGSRLQVLVDPSRDYNPVRIRLEAPAEFGAWADESVIELRQYRAAGEGQVWFPSSIQTFREVEGRTSALALVETESAEFNQLIPDEAFSLAGLELPIGTLVHRSPSSRQREGDSKSRYEKWNGLETVDLTVEDAELHRRKEGIVPDPGRSTSGWSWRLIGFNLVILGVAIVLFQLKR